MRGFGSIVEAEPNVEFSCAFRVSILEYGPVTDEERGSVMAAHEIEGSFASYGHGVGQLPISICDYLLGFIYIKILKNEVR